MEYFCNFGGFVPRVGEGRETHSIWSYFDLYSLSTASSFFKLFANVWQVLLSSSSLLILWVVPVILLWRVYWAQFLLMLCTGRMCFPSRKCVPWTILQVFLACKNMSLCWLCLVFWFYYYFGGFCNNIHLTILLLVPLCAVVLGLFLLLFSCVFHSQSISTFIWLGSASQLT